LKTIEDGVHTYDIFKDGVSKEKVGTKEFAKAVVARLGKKPEVLKCVDYSRAPKRPLTDRPPYVRSNEKRELVGADVFVAWTDSTDSLAAKLQPLAADGLVLEMISNRGMKVWPGGMAETFTVDISRCRFALPEGSGQSTTNAVIVSLLERLNKAGVDFVKYEGLYNFDGKPGFSRGQGQ
jgi:isocitrate dehydrogenase